MKRVLILQNCEIETAGNFATVLKELQIPFEVVHTYKLERFPDTADASAVISLGSPLSVNDYAQYDHLKRLLHFTANILRNNIPYLGICFGAQILAHLLGAPVSRMDSREIGAGTVTFTKAGMDDPLLQGLETNLQVFQWHGETFKLPFGATLLAEGNHCRNQAFRVGSAVGLQFHVELNSSDLPAWCDVYEKELADEAIDRDELLRDVVKNETAYKKLTTRLVVNFLL